jgi:perosamine synthetase
MQTFSNDLIEFIRNQYRSPDVIPLHAPSFSGNEKKYLCEAIDSTMVSSIGEFVVEFEKKVAEFTGAKYAVAVCSGTAALHLALLSAGVETGDEVLTQSLTFIATCNAISYCGAHPIFLDVERTSLGMCPDSLRNFLELESVIDNDGNCRNRQTGRIIRACVPVHNLGHPVRIDKIREICNLFHIALVEDAAEALGSFYDGQHVGAFGHSGVISFNGNKIITTGGGGMILTNSEETATEIRHLSTTAKLPHKWLYVHDQVGFNYRMPNLNAAVGCGQIETLIEIIEKKRTLASRYESWLEDQNYEFFTEASWAHSNCWLNAFFVRSLDERDIILRLLNENGIMARPMWTPMHTQIPYQNSVKASLYTSNEIENRLVCLPSSPTR